MRGLSTYLGASVAAGLVAELEPADVAWLCRLGAAVVLLAWRRPGKAAWHGKPFWSATLFGVVTAVVSGALHEAIHRLPLGTAVALEVRRTGSGGRVRLTHPA